MHGQTNIKIKFNIKPSGGKTVVACGQTDRQTDRHVEAFRNFANALNIAMTKSFFLDILKYFPPLN